MGFLERSLQQQAVLWRGVFVPKTAELQYVLVSLHYSPVTEVARTYCTASSSIL